MKLKRVLTGSALSLALLVSAAPAFAATPTVDSASQKAITPQAELKTITLKANTRGELLNVTVFAGVTYYLKDAWQNSDGTWTGLYQGWF
ncbi:LCI fold-containing protein [Bacillus sp. (in: firmicutes)]|uniref:LCI fold-containing protein n=1 Tax=Bacillus sp. TaxID=1409 RepID=UPI0023EF7EB0|nr:LCI fold-containing protein [Bacillus sp. (in: firmicutes)]